MDKKIALITGITGQDASYLAEILLEKGYDVHGTIRRSSTFNTQRIEHIRDKITTHYADMTDPFSLIHVLKKCRPTEIYNLAAMSHVQVSWETPYYCAQATGVGVLNLLESVRALDMEKTVRIYQASTSELYSGDPAEAPQDENTRFDPVSPYGTAKLYAYQICKNYREAFGMHISNGILFNHESERRGDNFVTQKIIKALEVGEVHLGNIDASRDWGYSKEYMEMAWKMLQQDTPDDYVVATGESHTVREFITWAEEVSGKKLKVVIDDTYKRPHDVAHLCGNPTKAMIKLGWKPKIKGKALAKEMYDNKQ